MSLRVKMADTYGDFVAYWSTASSMSVENQIDLWQASYMGRYRVAEETIKELRGGRPRLEEDCKREGFPKAFRKTSY